MNKHGLTLVEKGDAPPRKNDGNALRLHTDDRYTRLSRAHIVVDKLSRQSPVRKLVLATFLLFVLVPTLVYGAYLTFVASPQYSSEFRVLVRSSSNIKGVDFAQLLGAAGGKSGEDPYAVIQYIESQQAVTDLESRLDLRGHYANPSIDYFSRLRDGSTLEKVTRYWQRHLNAYYEATTGTVVVSISAFSPQAAQQIATTMLNLSEELVNRMSERSRQDLVSFSRSAVAEAENRLQLISQQLLDLRNRHGILDPQKYASVNLEQTAKLQEEITTLRAQVAVQRGYLSEDSPSVQLSLKQIEALEQELKAANAKITSANPGDENALSLTLKAFEQIQTDRDFAQKAYQASLAALQSAQADAARQSLYLDTIIAPTLAQEQYYPRPIKNTLFFLVLVFCGWVLVLLLGSSIRDHM